MEDKFTPLIHRSKINIFHIFNDLGDDDLRRVNENILDNKLYISKQFPLVNFTLPTGWHSDPLQNRTWCYWLHSLIMLEYLLNGYERFGDSRYLEKSCKLLLSWIDSNCPHSQSDMAWHDHGTALRLIVMCRFFEVWKNENWNPAIAQILTEAVRYHCRKLASNSFYTSKHNHGIDQDRALYVASTVFDNMEEASTWKELSLARLKIQLEELFLPDGGYLEPTPLYCYIFCIRLLRLIKFMKVLGDKAYEEIEISVNKQLDFLLNIVQPDRYFPAIGDANNSRLAIIPLKDVSPAVFAQFTYIAYKGEKGSKPEKLDRVYPDSGYAVLRNQWEINNNTVQVVFHASFHTKTHKHHDDLSFIVYGHKQPLLIDTGKYNYNYHDPKRSYVVSNQAHNTICVDDRDTDIHPKNVGKSGLTYYYFSVNFSCICGAHALYADVIHQRILLYFKPNNIVVLDLLDSSSKHKYEQVFNFHPSLTCISNNNIISASKDDKGALDLSPLYDINKTHLYNASEDPLRGWCCPEYSSLVPCWSAAYVAYGRKQLFAAHINLDPSQKWPVVCEQNNSNIEIRTKEIQLEIEVSSDSISIRSNNTELALNPIKPLHSIIGEKYV